VCKSNSCIASRAFDDGAPRLQQAKSFGILDDVEGGAVFDGATWVLEFCFAEDVAAGFFGEALEADEGGFPDCYNGRSVYECNWRVGCGTVQKTSLAHALGARDIEPDFIGGFYLRQVDALGTSHGGARKSARGGLKHDER
jgi:hypothetical protein